MTTSTSAGTSPPEARCRIDKWLWAARFYKTRGLAADEIDAGRIRIGDQPVKPAREVKVGDRISIRQGAVVRVVDVLGVSNTRGPAPVAQLLYRETPESVLAREQHAEARRLHPEPAESLEHGRPTKRDRRDLADWRRWSASLDDDGS